MECVKNLSFRDVVMTQLNLNCLDVGVIPSVLAVPTSKKAIKLYSLAHKLILV